VRKATLSHRMQAARGRCQKNSKSLWTCAWKRRSSKQPACMWPSILYYSISTTIHRN
jgi:hypothetical protein